MGENEVPFRKHDEIIAFWLEAGREKWFAKNEAFDEEIRTRGSALHERACKSQLLDWEGDKDGALGLVLLLDQFSRNLYRNDRRAYAQDGLALALARRAISRAFDTQLSEERRIWLYMPFMHSEDVLAQRQGLVYFRERLDNADALKYAVLHADIIERFGRFPHRNEVLGRDSSPEEIAYLAEGGFKG